MESSLEYVFGGTKLNDKILYSPLEIASGLILHASEFGIGFWMGYSAGSGQPISLEQAAAAVLSIEAGTGLDVLVRRWHNKRKHMEESKIRSEITYDLYENARRDADLAVGEGIAACSAGYFFGYMVAAAVKRNF